MRAPPLLEGIGPVGATILATRIPLLLAVVALGCPAPPVPTAPPVPAGAPRVVADGRGFTPSTLELRAGGPGALVFRRTTDDTCATAVVFPALGLERDLPLGVDVVLEVPTDAPRTLAFQCGMGMYRSRVVVQGR